MTLDEHDKSCSQPFASSSFGVHMNVVFIIKVKTGFANHLALIPYFIYPMRLSGSIERKEKKYPS
jgi:hypothetical protein